MPDPLLPSLILGLAILTSAVLRATAGHRSPSSDEVVSAITRQTILGCGALALKANLVHAAPSAGDMILVSLALIGLETLPLAKTDPQDD
jgi:hypothetical protein